MFCKEIIEDKNPVSLCGFSYRVCGRDAKYKIKYRSPINGKPVESNVCGIHFKAAEKNAKRIKERTGYDTQFQYEEIKIVQR